MKTEFYRWQMLDQTLMEVNFSLLISNPWLDGKHSVFGNVIEGQLTVDSISNEIKSKSRDY